MIFSAIIYLVGFLIGIIAFMLPDFHIFPDMVYDSFDALIDALLGLNSIFFFIDNLLVVVVFLIKFFAYFFIYKITVRVINMVRGTAGLE